MTPTRVSIQFTSLTKLWAFRMAINVNVFEMNLSQLTITCECSKEDIQLALEEYNGSVVQTKKQEA
jgi:hypothetical protein